MKKLIAIIAVLVIAASAITGYLVFIKPRSSAGDKNITIFVIRDEKTTLTKKYKTDKEYLVQLLEEKGKELNITFTTSSMGKYVTGIDNYVASDEKKEFYEITVDKEPASYGVSELPIEDGKEYTFKLTTY